MNIIDNSTPHLAEIYDLQIKNTIPYYEQFHSEIINLIKISKCDAKIWLDTGCGTGTLANYALKYFSNMKFILSDPSEGMLNQAKEKLSFYGEDKIKFLNPAGTEDIDINDNEKPDIITAIQSHHYLSKEKRMKATQKCYDILNENGMFIAFENISPMTKEGIDIGKKYWKQFQMCCGKDEEAAEKHMSRFGTEYFPITIEEHISLLRSCGFKVVELFWYSYMQAGFYCIKA